ncbi:glycosyltransferase family 4 protein [Alteromonas sp. 5E99-2]|uniref:glycosyltransferase family 4 protein n=1 Tax=Alteromonas sp. 5E99-2 TaxID=2817683 RepID=UPI001A9885FA|nr:glycosyltransferase family 4 protein [Alteromonas sp. 5E99-2]MBO1254242.1 glycosyltransferase family 4 protein [Alteromonas sp. 5E99-2]
MTNKVLSINQTFQVLGGSDRYYFNLNELLSKRGYDVIEFAAKGELEGESAFSKYFPEQVNFSSSNPMNLAKYLYNKDAKRKLSSLITDLGKPDFAHLQIYYGHLTVAIIDLLKQQGIPIVQTLHEYKFSCPVYTHLYDNEICEKCIDGNAFNAVIKRCKNDSLVASAVRYAEYAFSRQMGDIDKVDQFICVSKFQAGLMKRAGIPDHKLNVIYNFVDVNRDIVSFTHNNYLLYFGRLESLKGMDTLLESARRMPDVKFVVVGDGPYKTKMLESLKSGTLSNVEYLGFKSGDELWTLVKECKAVLVPSEWYENCSMTVLEAKAYGKPVIAARIGGITEQIVDGVNGYLHEPKDPDSLNNAIERLNSLSDEEYQTMSKESRNDLENRYSADVHYAKLKTIYEKVL